ncbi:MAG: DUF3106 domain-containing protein [Rubrivivax sp.]
MTALRRSNRTTRLIASLAACGALLALPVGAGAQKPQAPAQVSEPAWSALSPAQKAALAPLQRDWAQFDADRKKRWLELAQTYESMSPSDRQRVQTRMTEWSRLTSEERSRARLQFQQAQELGARDKQENWEAYQALPPDAKRDLARQSQADRSAADKAAKRKPPRSAGANDRPTPNAVAPAVIQGKPGASTTLMTNTPAAPPKPPPQKIVAPPGQVDKSTLLPKAARGDSTAPSGKPAAQ